MLKHYSTMGLLLYGLGGAFVSTSDAQVLRDAGACSYVANTTPLPQRRGYVAFMSDEQLAPFKEALPKLQNEQLAAILESPDTMWYDEKSMVFSYQDSVEFVVGLRANCVGRMVGEAHRNDEIGNLLKLFGEDYRFKYPFRTAAGTDQTTNTVVVNFWAPPKKSTTETWPVRWWKESNRGRWRWVFPKDTLFGEILFQRGSDNKLYPFELRTRKRYLDGWQVDIFRPFTTAADLATAIRARRETWEGNPKLKTVVEHLEDTNNLKPYTLQSDAYAKIFPQVKGALDVIPDLGDEDLVKTLLRETPFVSAEGAIWKEGSGLETYAPSSAAKFSIVPGGYEMGMFAVNEDTCNTCHLQTGRPLGNMIFEVILYGEIWGEDRIFTWHLFEPNERIFNTWDDRQGSRRINQKLVQAGLVSQGRPAQNDPNYRELPRPFQSQE